jgi:hypothetical protein
VSPMDNAQRSPFGGSVSHPRMYFVRLNSIIQEANKGVMATGTSRSSRWWIRASARLVPAPYPQRSTHSSRNLISMVGSIEAMIVHILPRL